MAVKSAAQEAADKWIADYMSGGYESANAKNTDLVSASKAEKEEKKSASTNESTTGSTGSSSKSDSKMELMWDGNEPSSAETETIAQKAVSKATADGVKKTAAISGTVNTLDDVNLVKGSKGGSVSKLQSVLNNLGYTVDVDGSYGSQTESAVKRLQADLASSGYYTSTVDGKAGPATRSAIAEYLNDQNKELTVQSASASKDTKSEEKATSPETKTTPTTTTKVATDSTVQNTIQANAANSGTTQDASASTEKISRPAVNSDGSMMFDSKTDYDAQIKAVQSQIASGDYTNAAVLPDLIEARNNKIAYLNKTGTNKWNAKEDNYGYENGVVTVPTTIYKATRGSDGSVTYGNASSGIISYEAGNNGTGKYTYADGTELKNGDKIVTEDGDMLWDTDTEKFISAEDYYNKYVKTSATSLSANDLLTMVSDYLTDGLISTEELDDFMTFAEAYAAAQNTLGAQYDKSFAEKSKEIDTKAAKTGFYGQLPVELLRSEALASSEVEKNAAINELALELMSEDRDAALDKLNAGIEAGTYNNENLASLLALILSSYNNEGTTYQTSGMKSGGATVDGFGETSEQVKTTDAESAAESTQDNAKGTKKTKEDYANLPGDTVINDSGITKDYADALAEIQEDLGIVNAQYGVYDDATYKAAGNITLERAIEEYNDTSFRNSLNNIMYLLKIGSNESIDKAIEAYESNYSKYTTLQKAIAANVINTYVENPTHSDSDVSVANR